MKQNRQYFGMTSTQIGILAALAGVACLLFGLVGWFVLRGNTNSTVPAPQATPAPQSTATPFVLATITPTETLTPVPYEMLVPDGWVQFKTGLVEIWAPAEFKQGDPKLYDDVAKLAIPELLIKGVTSEVSLYQMFIMVSYEPLGGDSLDAYLDSEMQKVPTDVRVAARNKVLVNSTEAVRFVFETRRDNVDVNDLAYVFLDGSTIWYVEYIAQINEFFEMVPTFEQSVKTFRIVR